jgi:hypothetical protein
LPQHPSPPALGSPGDKSKALSSWLLVVPRRFGDQKGHAPGILCCGQGTGMGVSWGGWWEGSGKGKDSGSRLWKLLLGKEPCQGMSACPSPIERILGGQSWGPGNLSQGGPHPPGRDMGGHNSVHHSLLRTNIPGRAQSPRAGRGLSSGLGYFQQSIPGRYSGTGKKHELKSEDLSSNLHPALQGCRTVGKHDP